jgi:hypothetical protein
LRVFDLLGLVWKMLAPNEEWAAWKAVQKGWLAFAAERGIALTDEREDTWPVVKRQLGVLDGVSLSLDGVSHSFDGYTLDAQDLVPLESLTCHVASRAHLPSFAAGARMVTGDADFDAELAVRTNDESAARVLLRDDLRAALLAFEPPIAFEYAAGAVKFSSGSTSIEHEHLDAVVAVVLAACRRPTSPYR